MTSSDPIQTEEFLRNALSEFLEKASGAEKELLAFTFTRWRAAITDTDSTENDIPAEPLFAATVETLVGWVWDRMPYAYKRKKYSPAALPVEKDCHSFLLRSLTPIQVKMVNDFLIDICWVYARSGKEGLSQLLHMRHQSDERKHAVKKAGALSEGLAS